MQASTISIETKELKEFMDKYPLLIPKVIESAVQIAGLDAESLSKKYEKEREKRSTYEVFGYSKGSGFSIRPRPNGRLAASLSRGGPNNIWEESKYQIIFGSNVKYAASIIGDTDPYVIKPKTKRFLIFAVGPNPKTDIRFAKQVTHPGGKALTGDGKNMGLLSRVAMVIEKNSQVYLDAGAKEVGIE